MQQLVSYIPVILIHAFSRFGISLNALCFYLVFGHIFAHISHFFRLRRGLSGAPCGGIARHALRATRLASPVALRATDAGPLIYALVYTMLVGLYVVPVVSSMLCVFFTLTRSFYNTRRHPAHLVSVPILPPINRYNTSSVVTKPRHSSSNDGMALH